MMRSCTGAGPRLRRPGLLAWGQSGEEIRSKNASTRVSSETQGAGEMLFNKCYITVKSNKYILFKSHLVGSLKLVL